MINKFGLIKYEGSLICVRADIIIKFAGAINMALTWDEGSGFFYHLASFGVGAGVVAVGVGAAATRPNIKWNCHCLKTKNIL